MFEQKFFRIAVCETPHASVSGMSRAETLMHGAIGLDDSSVDLNGYLSAGKHFLTGFGEWSREMIMAADLEQEDRENDLAELRLLVEQSKEVDEKIFLQILADDWKERHEVEGS